MTFEKRGAKKGRHPSSAERNRVRREESSWLEGGKSFAAGAGIFFSDLPIICRQTRDWEEFDKVFFPCVAGKSWWILIPLLRKTTTCTLLPLLASYSSQIHASPLVAAQHQVVGSLAGLILTGEGAERRKRPREGGDNPS